MKKISTVVPVYAHWPSLEKNIKSLKKYYSNLDWLDVHYVNDCGPEADELERRIQSSIHDLTYFHPHRIPKHLGFVKTCNRAAFELIDKKSDILLLNSDTEVTEHSIEAMQEVLYSESRIAAVSPRSNNATVWSIPMDARFAAQPQRSYAHWEKLKGQLPEKYLAPTAHGFCMLIKRTVIDKIGLFDEIYSPGYGEENDFTMRARHSGYTCAMANHAFVFHVESKSFGDAKKKALIEKNLYILTQRYPEYNGLIQEYIESTKDPTPNRSKAWHLRDKGIKALMYWHNHGTKSTLRRAYHESTIFPDAPQKIKIWTHELSSTGAPLVLLDVIKEWLAKGLDPKDIAIFYPKGALVHSNVKQSFLDLGVKVTENAAYHTHLSRGDIILLNSSAYIEPFYDDLLTKLENGTVQHLFWYVHEDSEVWVPSLREDNKNIKSRIQELIARDKITMYVPSSGSRNNWKKYANSSKNIHVMPGRVGIKIEENAARSAKDFDSINFITTGTLAPIKGQLSIVHAIDAFYHQHYLKAPRQYRDFKLSIVGLDNNPFNFYSSSTKNTARGLEAHVKLYPRISVDEVYKILRRTNFTITFSIAESFSMSTMEGMAFGHPIIRSESSGRYEQLGGNGWAVDTRKWYELVAAIEEVLNKAKTSNQKLADMSKRSLEIARQNYNQKYKIIKDIDNYLKKTNSNG